jgi:hypothetical protein
MSTSWKQNNFFGTVDIFNSIPLNRQKTRQVIKKLREQEKGEKELRGANKGKEKSLKPSKKKK